MDETPESTAQSAGKSRGHAAGGVNRVHCRRNLQFAFARIPIEMTASARHFLARLGPSRLALLVVAVAVGSAAPIQAGSRECYAQCQGQPDRGACRSMCDSLDIARPASTRATTYAAIAVKTGDASSYGYATAANSAASASATAMKYCASEAGKSGTCEIAVSFHDSCGALAVNADGGWGADYGSSRAEAGRKAMERCLKFNGKRCPISTTICSSD